MRRPFGWSGLGQHMYPLNLKSIGFNLRNVILHGRALEGSDPHELAGGFQVCQMKGTHIGASELTLFKSYEIGILRIRPLCFFIK